MTVENKPSRISIYHGPNTWRPEHTVSIHPPINQPNTEDHKLTDNFPHIVTVARDETGKPSYSISVISPETYNQIMDQADRVLNADFAAGKKGRQHASDVAETTIFIERGKKWHTIYVDAFDEMPTEAKVMISSLLRSPKANPNTLI